MEVQKSCLHLRVASCSFQQSHPIAGLLACKMYVLGSYQVKVSEVGFRFGSRNAFNDINPLNCILNVIKLGKKNELPGFCRLLPSHPVEMPLTQEEYTKHL